ncbi:unnamed protein product [Acanthoscelides obtectus]|uniref:DUF4371 domain-containing protein n=1 Tax=Acanthoscelides obtectus TaxID=200917 RepID=A0A9P0KP50_ACAOB|nr:unnamed protein product [Acanthoscelides obtectus]CAK1641644.1 Zinc finger MYM-type protein 1 [Acanthoscelides obtectus]
MPLRESSKNAGNFSDLLKFRIDAGDQTLGNHLFTAAGNSKYTPHRIQNEIISLAGEVLLRSVVEEANSSKYFSVLADETADIAGHEQLSIGIRYVFEQNDKFTLKEEFLGFVKLDRLNADSIASSILQFLEKSGLNLDKLVGQGYDGCSTMSGEIHGVQKIIQEKYKRAFYFHCASHKLNLVINDVKAPTLNLEIKATISSSVQKRDERLSALQRQIGASLSCIGSALTLILKEEGGGNRTYIQLLNDASKLLTDLHRTETIARRELVALNLNSDVKQILSEATVDGLLFGTDLEARLKSSKDLDKSGRELKAVKAKPLQNAAKPLNYQSLPRYQQGARRGGHQHQSPSYSTNRNKPRREPPRRLNQRSQNSCKLKTRNPRQ